MDKVRIGIIGFGGIARLHASKFTNNEIPSGILAAVADESEESLEWAKSNLPETVKRFSSAEDLYNSKEVDAVLIATPHYDHPPLAISAFNHGLHVLSEKPAGVYTQQVNEMNAAAKKSGKVFEIMFNQRTNPLYQKMRQIVQSGELGEIVRVNLIITDWFRAQSYYDKGGWRGTWKGEGGGVLLNQCPHNLDLWQWICGMPKRLMAFCNFGRLHNVEVEDEVTCYVEYENGANGVFVASTGEVPGTNRFEIVGDRGKLIYENNTLIFYRSEVSISEHSKTTKSGFSTPDIWKCEIPINKNGGGHAEITNNFIDAIQNDTKLLAPGEEGLNSLRLSNAMLLSSWENRWVDIPFDDNLFYNKLSERIEKSTYVKPEVKRQVASVAGSF